MRVLIISGFVLLAFFLACQQSSVQSVQPKVNEPQKTATPQETVKGNSQYFKDNLLLPSATQKCLAEVNIGDPFGFDLSKNPYYLRGNLDGNKLVDYAVIIVSKNTRKTGLVICKDSKVPFVFGELAKSKTPLTDMENDNFIASSWDIVTREEVREWYSNVPNEMNKRLVRAKGEIIEFLYEIDGVLYIYWDGKAFQAVGE